MLGLSDIRRRTVSAYAGTRIISSPLLVETVEDWSRVRSPVRAARRRKLGHPQNIRSFERPMPQLFMVGGDIYAHPATLAAVHGEARDRLNRQIDQSMLRMLSP